MKSIPEYLSGSHDEELRMLVAEAVGWAKRDQGWYHINCPIYRESLPPYPASRDACEELLADLTEEEWPDFSVFLAGIVKKTYPARDLLCATARQICVAYLIVKGVLK